jgi:hypothetical protein
MNDSSNLNSLLSLVSKYVCVEPCMEVLMRRVNEDTKTVIRMSTTVELTAKKNILYIFK